MMGKPKAQTLQQRFGFMDNDLKKPDHDRIMIWLDRNIEDFCSKIYGWQSLWSKEEINKIRDQEESIRKYIETTTSESIQGWDGLGEIPECPGASIHTDWEFVIKPDKFIVGFVDLRAEIALPSLEIDGAFLKYGTWHIESHPRLTVKHWIYRYINFETKTEIPSLGELLRQINMYRSFNLGRFVVVSPDDRFSKQLNNQGIGFIKYPTGEILK